MNFFILKNNTGSPVIAEKETFFSYNKYSVAKIQWSG